MQNLSPAFQPRAAYLPKGTYRLLPFQFIRLDQRRYALVNLVGEHYLVDRSVLEDFINHRLPVNCESYNELKSRNMLADSESDIGIELLALKERSKRARLPEFTALHYFIITLRCEHSCEYCQVSRVSQDKKAFDMSQETADKAIDYMLRSPSEYLKVEFQGGEPLLNFPLLKYIVETTERRANGRDVQFVVATNLALINDEILDFLADHRVLISTSLDGPAELHDSNRHRPGGDSYDRTIRGIAKARDRLGWDSVSALMTSTPRSIEQPIAIVDEYVRQGFNEIFLRWISPYGFAARGSMDRAYDAEKYVEFYRRALDHIIKLNLRGQSIRETYSSLILKRILTPFPHGYVDLQSPAGIGISAVAYNYDGDVYPSDEARMLAAMGDTKFRMGNLHRDSYEQLFTNSALLPTIHETMIEGLPGCSECAFQHYCGTDPVFNYRAHGDVVGHRPTSDFCKRNMAIMKHLLLLLEDFPEAAKILRSWALS